MVKMLATWVLVAAAVLLLPAAVQAKLHAISGGVGQYLVHKCGDEDTINLYNPNKHDYFSLFIVMDRGGDPQTDAFTNGACRGAIVPRHGTDEQRIADDISADDGRQMCMVISVPLPSAKWNKGMKRKLGIVATTKQGNQLFVPVKPTALRLSGSRLHDILDCACLELADLGQAPTLLSKTPVGACP